MWPPGHFALGFFRFSDRSFGNGVFSLVCGKLRNGQLATFIKVGGQITSDTLWK